MIEHWSAANNSNCSNGPNAVIPVSLCIGYTPVTCSNVTNGGQIGNNQSSCLANYDPTTLTNTTSPSGGSGALEYLWFRSTTTCLPPNGTNDAEWEAIPNSNAATFDPGPIYQNTCYIRRSRRAGCTNYDGISNVVSVTVSGPVVQVSSSQNLVKDRVISNEVHCGNSNQRVLWMDCFLDNAPGGTSGNAKYWKIISGGGFREFCDGTAFYEMRVQNLSIPTYELDIKVVLSGRTFTPPPGSPRIEGCTSSAMNDWYYYTNMTGTISGVNGLSGALLSIERNGSSFQAGTNASLYAGPGQFGASAEFAYNVINHPVNFKLKGGCGADFNFLLSGGVLTSAQASNCNSICFGASTQLTANGVGGRPGYTHTWDNNLGSGQTKTVSPSTTTTYKVTITDTNGCASTSQTTIFINPQPVLNAGQDVGICQGQSVLLTVNATNGSSPYTYSWPSPPGGTGTSKSVSPTTTTTYVVTVTDAKGCKDTDDVTVSINSNPVVGISGITCVCAGGNISLNAQVTGGTPNYSFLWSGPGGFTGTGNPLVRNQVNAAMAGSYSVTVTDSKGCAHFAATVISVVECEGEICFIGTDNPTVSAKSTYQIIYSANPAQNKLRIRTTFSKNFVDNTYGNNAIGWPNGHTFGNLTGSDHLQIALYDANNVKKLELKLDYLTASSAAPSGYKSLGVSGGEGSMIFGNASDVLNVVTSLDQNFNTFGYVLTTNSPETNDDYMADPNYPNWIYEVWYEAEVKLSAFGAAGFGTASITGIHASPSKTGNNTEMVTPGDCCDLFDPQIDGANFKCNDSPESIQRE